jgi:uncharacterized protein with HEPN domain
MSPDDRIRLRHMADAIDSASQFLEGRSRAELEDDRMLVFALVRAVEIVGEAASKVSSEGRAELPQVPWNSMVGMRNRLVHGYFDVDLDILWNTATQALPELRRHLGPALSSRAEPGEPG